MGGSESKQSEPKQSETAKKFQEREAEIKRKILERRRNDANEAVQHYRTAMAYVDVDPPWRSNLDHSSSASGLDNQNLPVRSSAKFSSELKSNDTVKQYPPARAVIGSFHSDNFSRTRIDRVTEVSDHRFNPRGLDNQNHPVRSSVNNTVHPLEDSWRGGANNFQPPKTSSQNVAHQIKKTEIVDKPLVQSSYRNIPQVISNDRNTIFPIPNDSKDTLPEPKLETNTTVKPLNQSLKDPVKTETPERNIRTATTPTVSQASSNLRNSTTHSPLETSKTTQESKIINKPLDRSQNLDEAIKSPMAPPQERVDNDPIGSSMTNPSLETKIENKSINTLQDRSQNLDKPINNSISPPLRPINNATSSKTPILGRNLEDFDLQSEEETKIVNKPPETAFLTPLKNKISSESEIQDCNRNKVPITELINILSGKKVTQDNKETSLDSKEEPLITADDSYETYSGSDDSDEESSSSFSADSDEENFTVMESRLNTFSASLTDLAPKASTENKEVVTISKEGTISDKEAHIRRMINTIFLLEYLVDYVTKKNEENSGNLRLKDIVGFDKDCPKPFVRVIQYYPGHNFEDKLEEFILTFNFVFTCSSEDPINGLIKINASSKEFIDNSYKSLIKDIIVYLIGEDRKELDNIAEFIRELFKSEPFHRYANCTSTHLSIFAKSYPSEFHVDKTNRIHIVEILENPSSAPKETRSLRAEVISFFEKEMKLAGGLFIKDLSKLLSWKKSELLANLSDRSPESIFQILQSSNSFESKDNKIYLRSVTSKLSKSTAKTEPDLSIPSKSSSSGLKPQETKTISSDLKSEEMSISCCMVGTIFALGKISGTIFCAPGSNSKTMFALIYLGTTINSKIELGFSCLNVGDKVFFSAKSSVIDGLIKWTALNIITSVGKNYNCPTCKKQLNVNHANSQTNITNGIASDNKKTFFWNVQGKINALGTVHMTIGCYLSRKSNKQRMNVYCDKASILLDSEGNQLKNFTNFTFEEVVECDVLLVSQNYELLWVAIEVRKTPFNYEKIYQNDKIAYNCEGLVSSHQGGIGRVMVLKSQTNKSIEGKNAEYCQKKVWFMRSQFPVQNFDSRLNLTDKIIFDAVMGSDGKWNVYIIRKTLRPFPSRQTSDIEFDNNPVIICGNKNVDNAKANEFYLAEMSEVTNSLLKPYNLTSVLADTLDISVINKNKKNGITQTMSTGPIVSVTSVAFK